jgi:hypothetical protein
MTKTRWIFQAALIAGSAFFLSSCSWFMGESSDQEVKELDERMSAAKRETAYDNALLEFGKLLTAYDVAPTPVQSKNIGNETADKALPSDVYTMVSTAVGKIGAEVVFIPYRE